MPDISEPALALLKQRIRNQEAEACARIAAGYIERVVVESNYDQGFVEAAEFIRDGILARIAQRLE